MTSASLSGGSKKYAILLAFIAAAILTPPDVISQILQAVPVIILYELSIIGARIIEPKEDLDAHKNNQSIARTTTISEESYLSCMILNSSESILIDLIWH